MTDSTKMLPTGTPGIAPRALTSAFTRYFTRRAGQIAKSNDTPVEAQWATEPQEDSHIGHIFWGTPDAWPPWHWEEFVQRGDGWIVNTGWNLNEAGELLTLRTVRAFLTISGSRFDITVPGGPQRYALSMVPVGSYQLDTTGEMWANGAKVGDYRHVQMWGPPRLVNNPLWFEGPKAVQCIHLHEQWTDSGGKKTEEDVDYALDYGVGWRIESAEAGTRYLRTAWSY